MWGWVADAATRGWARALTAVVVVAVAAIVGVLSAGSPDTALLVAFGVFTIGVLVVDPTLLPVFALPATLLMARVGGLLSISDVVLAGATILAIILVRGGEMRSMAPLFWGGAAYLAAALPTTILNPYSQNIIEWVHEAVLVLGSLAVGFAVGRLGRARLATQLYILGCVGVAIVTIITGMGLLAQTGSFGPVYLPELHKNLIGSALAGGIVILYGRPKWYSIAPVWAWSAIVLCGVGVLASQSRQAMIGLAAGLVVVAMRRNPETGRFPKLPWLAAIPIAIGVLQLVGDQLASDDRFNSAYQRLDWYDQSIAIWQNSPWFGVGLRWWYTGRFGGGFQPPNAELEVLSSVGVVGLIGFAIMFVVGIITLWRIDPAYGTVGAAVVISRIVQAQFDLYWVAGQSSWLWIIAGLCIGALEHDRARARADAQGMGSGTPVYLRRSGV
ncbi:hypothetical protein GCM10022240_00210 [Microbacterium kribbense]|uniref:O-antigen ligase-related domain-containing protein n=1 Tax=Microbacterium kribbense TaxID=433645 RepID=A0ABP7FXF1_9MICO